MSEKVELSDKKLFLDTDGKLVTVQNDQRIIWFSARCTFWTDDWNRLNRVNSMGIPTCPHCQSPGVQATYYNWMRSAKRYNDQVDSRYLQFVHWAKEKCIANKDGKALNAKQAFVIWKEDEDGKQRMNQLLKNSIDQIDG